MSSRGGAGKASGSRFAAACPGRVAAVRYAILKHNLRSLPHPTVKLLVGHGYILAVAATLQWQEFTNTERAGDRRASETLREGDFDELPRRQGVFGGTGLDTLWGDPADPGRRLAAVARAAARRHLARDRPVGQVARQRAARAVAGSPGQRFLGGLRCRDRAFTMFGSAEGEFAAALDVRSGKTLWKARCGELFKNSYGDGPRATPAFDEGRVYALGGKGSLACLDAASGKPIWQLNLLEKFGGEPPEYGFSASPLVLGKLLVVVVGAGHGKSLLPRQEQRKRGLDQSRRQAGLRDATADRSRRRHRSWWY